MTKKLSKAKIEKLAVEIRDLLLEHEMWIDTRIYFNGKCFSTDDTKGNHYYNDKEHLVTLENEDPAKYTKWVGEGILVMTFEVPLYSVMNSYGEYGFSYEEKIYDKLLAIFKKYGLYFELGEAWNLAAAYL